MVMAQIVLNVPFSVLSKLTHTHLLFGCTKDIYPLFVVIIIGHKFEMQNIWTDSKPFATKIHDTHDNQQSINLPEAFDRSNG